MDISIDSGLDGITIKKCLFDKLFLSRGMVTELKKRENGIRVNGEHKTVRYILKQGDVLSLEFKDEFSSEKIKECDGEIDVIYEDDCILAVNKPCGLAVHPSKKIQDDTLAGRVIKKYKPMVFRAVGRLDKDTSGVVILTKDRMTAGKLYDQTRLRKTEKEYILITYGGKLPEEGVIKTGIRRHDTSYIKRICVPENEASESEKAETHYKVLMYKDGYSLIKANPVTGRTHQLRAHFSSLGSPIIGDTLYGKESEFILRQALHARKITFFHPRKNEIISILAPLWPDMKNALCKIFGEEAEKLI